jgi:ribosomal protein L29
VERELAENRSQLEGAEKTYQELMSARDVSIKAAQKKMEELKYALSDLKIKKATAELTEMAGGMIRTIGGAGDTLDRLHNMVAEERDKAAGRVRVAKDSFEIGDIHLKETEQKALADQALADFAAKEGLALPSQASAPATLEHPVKSMGPLPQ